MRSDVFQKLWADIHHMHGLIAPNDHRRNICEEKTAHIPNEAAPWICRQFEDMETRPRNLVKAIRDLWQRWKESNPERVQREYNRCRYCLQDTPGQMLVLRFFPEQGYWAETVMPCGHCGAGWTVQQIADQGWYKLAGWIIPPELEPLLHLGRTEAELAFRNGAEYHELAGLQ